LLHLYVGKHTNALHFYFRYGMNLKVNPRREIHGPGFNQI